MITKKYISIWLSHMLQALHFNGLSKSDVKEIWSHALYDQNMIMHYAMKESLLLQVNNRQQNNCNSNQRIVLRKFIYHEKEKLVYSHGFWDPEVSHLTPCTWQVETFYFLFFLNCVFSKKEVQILGSKVKKKRPYLSLIQTSDFRKMTYLVMRARK